MRSRNSVPETFYFSDNHQPNLIYSLAKCDMGIQREKTQKRVNLQGYDSFFTGLKILARRVAIGCLEPLN